MPSASPPEACWAALRGRPGLAMRLWLVHAASRVMLAVVLVYHGLVPKLIVSHPDELAMLEAGGVSSAAAPGILTGVGLVEVALGAAVLLAWRWTLPLWTVLARAVDPQPEPPAPGAPGPARPTLKRIK